MNVGIQSHFSASPQNLCLSLPKGAFNWGFCAQCQYVSNCKTFRLPKGAQFVPRHFVHCATLGVVFLLSCTCGDFYVGKTIKPFNKRISDHIRDNKIGNLKTPIGRHAAFKHGHKDCRVTFKALDHVNPYPRGVNLDKKLLCLENKWIFYLKATPPPGPNNFIRFKLFYIKLEI